MKIPVDFRLKTEKLIEDRIIQGKQREYLGLSQIGRECPRSLWYDFRFCSKNEYSARIERLFQRGHREEPVIIADLKKIGIKVHSEQFEVVCGYGHIKGHIDGGADNIPDAPKTTHLLEFKTMKEGVTKTSSRKPTYFHLLQDVGVKKANPLYYIQCQCYMYLTGWKRTLFIAVNKNNDSRYYERIHLLVSVAEEAIRRGEHIIFNETPPLRFESFKCNWCSHKPICKERITPQKNCRTCQYCNVENQGKWSCSEKKRIISLEEQLWKIKKCSKYKLLNTLDD